MSEAALRLRRVAVTGASGFVGRALCRRLLQGGVAVQALVRRAANARVPAGAEVQSIGDLATADAAAWNAVLRQPLDTVFHVAAVAHHADAGALHRINVEATRMLAQACFRRGARLVYVSTVKVYGEPAPAKVDGASLPHPDDDYGRSKLDAEQVIAQEAEREGGDWLALRPPLVYGAEERGNFARLVRLAVSGWPLPLGAVHNRRSMIHVDVLADALVHAAQAPDLSGRAWPVSGGPAWSTGEWLRRIAHAAGRPSRLWPCPPGLLLALARGVGAGAAADRLLGSLEVDDAHWRAASGWLPPLPQASAVTQTVQALRPGQSEHLPLY